MPVEIAAQKKVTALEEPILPVVQPARLDRAESAAESYRKVEAEILELPEALIGRVTADVAQAASIALGARPNLLKLRDEFLAFPHADTLLERLDRLQDYAMAAFYTHIRSLSDSSDQEVQELLERGRPIRERLLGVAEALVGFELVDESLVQNIRAGQGNLDTAQDLVALATLFNVNWEFFEHKVPFARELVLEAGAIGTQLLHAIGIKEIGEVRRDASLDWSSLRARAFRLLVNEYEELRRAVGYVRWHQKDADAFAPSLHTTSHKRRRLGTGTNEETEDVELPGNPLGTLPPPGTKVAPGMPGEDPFES